LTQLDEYLDPTIYAARNEPLNASAKLDVFATFKATDNLTVFARAEDLTNAVDQEIYGYGAAERSFYAGLTYSW
jgi:vitamin B12 transporter